MPPAIAIKPTRERWQAWQVSLEFGIELFCLNSNEKSQNYRKTNKLLHRKLHLQLLPLSFSLRLFNSVTKNFGLKNAKSNKRSASAEHTRPLNGETNDVRRLYAVYIELRVCHIFLYRFWRFVAIRQMLPTNQIRCRWRYTQTISQKLVNKKKAK